MPRVRAEKIGEGREEIFAQNKGKNQGSPFLYLAPMQDVTDVAFMRTLHALGTEPDVYVTPYFRVVSHHDTLDPDLLEMVISGATTRPVVAQIIGSDGEALCRVARALQEYPIGGIDLNLGCPAPIVCRKSAGGGALRNPSIIAQNLTKLREVVTSCPFSVKTRLGYDQVEEFEDLLSVYHLMGIDLLTVHGRTVREGYRTPVHVDFVNQAVRKMSCPVVANGNIVDVRTAEVWRQRCHPAGLMVGRGAVRNPWVFSQIRASLEGKQVPSVTLRDLRKYIYVLFEETARTMRGYREISHIHRMKKFMVYICQGLPPEFEYQIRRTTSSYEFHQLCDVYLDHEGVMDSAPPINNKLFIGHENLI